MVTDMYVGGVSTRKVKDALKAVAGEKIRLSKTTVSRITKRVREEFKIWQKIMEMIEQLMLDLYAA